MLTTKPFHAVLAVAFIFAAAIGSAGSTQAQTTPQSESQELERYRTAERIGQDHLKKFEANLDDYNKIMLQALADRFAEAFAEALHLQTRKEFWGYVKDEKLSNEELIKEQYTGIRPAPGYPACPDHTEKYKLFDLLKATDTIGIQLTESLAMYPASSVCGWYFSNPKSQYFGIGKIQRDQLEDYAKRKNMPIEIAERWLSPVLE